jgi:cobalt/nickel transport system permease protein
MPSQQADAAPTNGSGRLHGLPPQCALAATVLFVFAVVATPKEAWWAFLVHAGIVVAVAASARVPAGAILRRLRFEVPFVLFAVLLPIVGTGRRVDLLGVSLSVAGMWAAWNIVAKATLGVAGTGVLVATASVPELLAGMERLRVPRVFVAIAGSMVRYVDVIVGEMHRMRVARSSRAYDPRWLWQARAVAAGTGALFVRSYERGERVFLAMQSRGFDGRLPALDEASASRRQWCVALSVPLVAALVAAAAWSSVA